MSAPMAPDNEQKVVTVSPRRFSKPLFVTGLVVVALLVFGGGVVAGTLMSRSGPVPNARVATSPSPTSRTKTATPLALENVDWSKVNYGVDCSDAGVGIQITGKVFFDITGDGAKEAFVRVGCHFGTGPPNDQVEVFGPGPTPLSPHLLGILAQTVAEGKAGVPFQAIQEVTAFGPVVTVSALGWGANAALCCPDITWTKTYIWSAGKFHAGATTSHPLVAGLH